MDWARILAYETASDRTSRNRNYCDSTRRTNEQITAKTLNPLAWNALKLSLVVVSPVLEEKDMQFRPGAACCLIGLALLAQPAASRAEGPAPSAAPAAVPRQDKDAILLTIFLRHDQSKTLGEINDYLKQNGYYAKFPPAEIEMGAVHHINTGHRAPRVA